MEGRTRLSLLARAALKSLKTLFCKVIGLQFSNRCLGLFPLGSNEIIPMAWELGSFPTVKLKETAL